MALETRSPGVLRFGTFEADLRAGELRKQGRRIKVQEQPFQVLIVLLQRPGDVVTREDLRSQIWPEDTFVDFDNSLNTAINKLREALGDSADSPRFIETLPRRGYRFIGPVDGIQEATGAKKIKQAREGRFSAQKARWIGVIVLFVALIAMSFALNVFRVRDRLWGASPAQIQSLAVLPLTNLSGDPNQEYFADGMTEELITELGKVGALRVISHTSVNQFKGSKLSMQDIARQLQVDALVEGIVEREDHRVRITANLVQAFPEKHLWAQTYDRDLHNVMDLQSEIARTVADQIKIAVTPEERLRLTATRPVDPEAHELLLKGDFYMDKWTAAGFAKSAEYFNESLKKDPQNAQAYAGLALAYAGIGISDATAYPKEKAAALRALELDDTIGAAHNALAWAELTYDWDTAKAESEFRRAIELNPNDSRAHAYYGIALAMLGRIEDSLREVRRTRELDPLSLAKTSLAWRTYYNARDYQRAIEALQSAADLDPNFVASYERMIPIYEQMGDLDKAIQMRERAAALDKESEKELMRQAALLRKAYSTKGARGYWLQSIEIHNLKQHPRDAIRLAADYTRLGRKDEAFRCLQEAFKARVPYLIWEIPASPAFDDLRSDPRYADLLRRLVPRSD